MTLAVAGTIAAVLGARAVAHSDAGHAREAFRIGSGEVASTLELAIQHEQDLVADTSAFVAGDPTVSPAGFDRWSEAAGAMHRYPELQDIGLVALVPASHLKAFEAHLAANPIRPLGPNSLGPKERFEILPAGKRPYYCFAIAGPGTHARDLPPGRGRLLRPGPGTDRRARLREGHLRAGPRREQERARGADAGLRRRRRAHDGGRSTAGVRGLARRAAGTRGRAGAGAADAPEPRRDLPLQPVRVEDRLQQRIPTTAPADHDDRPAQRLVGADVRAGAVGQHLRPLERAHDAARRHPPERRHRTAGAGTRDRAQARAVARTREDLRAVGEEPRACPPGTARPPHRAPQPRAGAGPRRTADRAHGAASWVPSPEPCSSTSTASSTSTTTTATRPETSC